MTDEEIINRWHDELHDDAKTGKENPRAPMAHLLKLASMIRVDQRKSDHDIAKRRLRPLLKDYIPNNPAGGSHNGACHKIARAIISSGPKKDWICPSCGGSHFGRDVLATEPEVKLGDAVCHDEYSEGCKWKGPFEEAIKLLIKEAKQ